jgi:hypothetical protein
MFGNMRSLVSAVASSRHYSANTIYRRRQDHGCQPGKFEAVVRAQMGTFWETKDIGDFRESV